MVILKEMDTPFLVNLRKMRWPHDLPYPGMIIMSFLSLHETHETYDHIQLRRPGNIPSRWIDVHEPSMMSCCIVMLHWLDVHEPSMMSCCVVMLCWIACLLVCDVYPCGDSWLTLAWYHWAIQSLNVDVQLVNYLCDSLGFLSSLALNLRSLLRCHPP